MTELPEFPAGEGRKGDGVIFVVQNNEAHTLTIANTNENAANLLGYAGGDLDSRALEEILGKRTVAMLGEELEFTVDAPDFGDIFSRQRNIRLRSRIGEEMTLPCTVLRMMSEGQQARFQLVLPNEREHRAQQQLKDFLKANLEGRQQIDPTTKLPDKATTEAFMGLLQNYLASNQMSAVFAVIRLDRFDKSVARYGRTACAGLLQHAANCCRSTFRTEDVISALSDRTLGVILFDISRDSARLVFNRLRWNIGNHHISFGGKTDFSVTISIAFDMLDPEGNDDLIARCEKASAAIDSEARNALVEVGE